MDIFQELGIRKYINAHDTYTVYGGSRMSEGTLEVMRQISRHFVDFEQLQRKVGQKIAAMTGNEGAYVSNGAAGALATAAAVCMAGENPFCFSRLPRIEAGVKDEIILFRGQHNAYDKAIESTGARIVLIGDADETLSYELEGVIGERTAAVFYFVSTLYERASMSLEETIRIAHARGVPVVVDAAAQLPPVSNLSGFTKMGADLVIFSGGKTLCGPQDSGLMVGRRQLIERCIRYGAPNHGILRTCKASREAIVGLYQALKEYLQKDPEAETRRLMEINLRLREALEAFPGVRETKIVPHGPVGQTYPRVFARFADREIPPALHAWMQEQGIYIGLEMQECEIYLSPLNLNDSEVTQIIRTLREYPCESPEEKT